MTRPALFICSVFAVSLCASFVIAGGGSQLFKLLPDDGINNDEFGFSVAASGTVGIIGSRAADTVANDNTGSAYLFDLTTGLQLAELAAAQTDPNDQFGFSVGISGQLAIVGALLNGDNGQGAGAAYLFDTQTGLLTQTLFATDFVGSESFDRFGTSVGISGANAIVGAPSAAEGMPQTGAAYIFDTATGTQLRRLAVETESNNNRFGISVAIDGNLAVIGASGDDENAFDAGAAYFYDLSTDTLTRITPADAQAGDEFGISVAIRGDIAVIGARSDDDNGSQAGSAYLYHVPSGALIAKLLSNDGTVNDRFGSSVGISNTTVIVGAFGTNDLGGNSGSAYLFDIATGLQLDELIAGDGQSGDEFGAAVAIDGQRILIGALEDNNKNGFDAGAAYVFEQSSPVCPGDCDGSGAIDFNDLVSMLFEFGNPMFGDGCDADASGGVDFNDLVAALFLFGPCP